MLLCTRAAHFGYLPKKGYSWSSAGGQIAVGVLAIDALISQDTFQTLLSCRCYSGVVHF